MSHQVLRLFVFAVGCLVAPAVSAGTIRGTVQVVGPERVEDVVVYVDEVSGTFPPSEEPHIMDQKEKTFIPNLLPILKGEQVTFLNSDPFLHNVHPYLGRKSLFNRAIPPGGAPVTRAFKDAGEVVVLCNVHPEMEAWIVVRDNPYFAVTGAEGAYEIQHVPSGTYAVKAWHPTLKPGACDISVEEEGEALCDFELHRN